MPPDVSPSERRELYFSGRVQGVGFRYRARDLAARFPLTGFVRNLADGRVELVVEGAAENIDRFLTELNARMAHNIQSVDQSHAPPTGEFEGFEIRF
jgi:acylphosphatase